MIAGSAEPTALTPAEREIIDGLYDAALIFLRRNFLFEWQWLHDKSVLGLVLREVLDGPEGKAERRVTRRISLRSLESAYRPLHLVGDNLAEMWKELVR